MKHNKIYLQLIFVMIFSLCLNVLAFCEVDFDSDNLYDYQVMGDYDNDNCVTVKDARMALRASARLETPNKFQLKAVDVDNNGKITAGDARIVLRVSTNLQKFVRTIRTEPGQVFFTDKFPFGDGVHGKVSIQGDKNGIKVDEMHVNRPTEPSDKTLVGGYDFIVYKITPLVSGTYTITFDEIEPGETNTIAYTFVVK